MLSATMSLLSSSAPVASWGNLYDHLIEEEKKTGQIYKEYLPNMLAEVEIGCLQH